MIINIMKKFILLLIALQATVTISSRDVRDNIIQLQKSEAIIVDTIYDRRDYATELWNEAVLEVNEIEKKKILNKGVTVLNSAEELGALLLEIQDQLIIYYTEYEKSEENLKTAKGNRVIGENLLKEITLLKEEFLTVLTP